MGLVLLKLRIDSTVEDFQRRGRSLSVTNEAIFRFTLGMFPVDRPSLTVRATRAIK